VLAVAANPKTFPTRLADQFDAVCPFAAFFQADTYVGAKPGHFFDPSDD